MPIWYIYYLMGNSEDKEVVPERPPVVGTSMFTYRYQSRWWKPLFCIGIE